MIHAAGMLVAGLSLLGAGPAAQWLGQDGQDVVGAPQDNKPNDVQDIHIRLVNLPSREIKSLRVLRNGGGEWKYPSRGMYAAVLQRRPGAPTADLFVEPITVEKNRSYAIVIEFDGGAKAELYVRAVKVDANLRMPGAALGAKWVGQDRQDWTGPDVGVGPDGLQDVRIALTKLSPAAKVDAAELEAPGGQRWHAGLNPKGVANAELVRDEKDRTRAEFFFQPQADLAGKALRLTVHYENGKADTATLTGGKADLKLKMPLAPLPRIAPLTIKAEWRGQDGSSEPGPGAVHVVLRDLPSRPVAAVVLSDAVRGTWLYRENDRVPVERELETRPLVVRRAAGGRQLDLFFDPYRDEAGTTMTVRLVFQDGSMGYARFPGGRSDIARRAPAPAATSASAKPGDDIQDLVNRFGTVRLTRGTYRLTRPLVIDRPLNLVGEPGAVLLFSQAASEPEWAAAVKIHRGVTTLQGFAIRFAGPVRWNAKVSWRPGIIGMTDDSDKRPAKPVGYVVFEGLDIEAPPAANPTGWEHAPHLIRLVGAAGGVVAKNTLRGGDIEMFDGPWRIEGNDYRGTPPATYCDQFVAIHNAHDLVLRGNRLQPADKSGKTWRFLVMTGQGARDRIEDNTMIGIGARDDDTIPWSNAPEIMLTESYTILFEGKPAAISADGRLVRIAKFHGRAPRTGDVVGVLAGAVAGQWRKIAQALDGTTFLLDEPLPAGAEVVSIASGFVDELFQKNTLEAPGATRSNGLELTGNHFGTRVLNNRFAGAGGACELLAYFTEAPVFPGWSHVPFLGGEITGNVFEDAERGARFGVAHGKPIKTNRGRAYMTLTLQDNTVRWTEAFLARQRSKGAKALPPGVVLGAVESIDPGEMRIAARGNRLDAPKGTPASVGLTIHSAVVNDRPVIGKTVSLSSEDAPAQVGRKER